MLASALVVLSFCVEVIVAQCPVGWSLTSNRTRLYLYFPAASDAAFPEDTDPNVQISPLAPFNVSDLDSGIGTTAQLRDRITDIVREDYCEFDVEIFSGTTAPATTGSQWQIVGIGSDAATVFGSNLFGTSSGVDNGNVEAQDRARMFAGSFGAAYGSGSGEPALGGANSTLERWATAIGSTVSHEAGHNFGLNHTDANPRTGEDDITNHIMATGGSLTGEIRASRNRHFSDRSYEILGHNIGLRIKTLQNWDFTNPNAEDAHSLVLTLLSPASSLTLNWFYNGSLSPWTNPTVAAAGTQSFQGTTYNKFTLTFSAPKAWSGGPNGVVPGGVMFHTGATFAEPDPVIVYETRVRDSGGTNLNLHPRLIGFNAGALDLSSGDFSIRAFNTDPARALVIEDLQVHFLPRMASIESMVNGAELRDVRDVPVERREPGRAFEGVRSREVREFIDVRLATSIDKRSVETFYDPTNCKPGLTLPPGTTGTPGGAPTGSPNVTPTGPGDVDKGEYEYCPRGWVVSLFPSTYVYVVATVLDPNARYWDRAQAKYVEGPLRSKVFYQFSGIVPDFNKNGVDDLIDIKTNTSPDRNGNGVVDEAERGGETRQPGPTKYRWWLWILILLIILLLLWLLLRRRRRA
ncbi:MAG TPA: hypothetical protein VFX96_16005 [Pyrinomonadaceae bacterium]|nr:hypothetical protein [Pyrinomonadaceae bacterium]